MGCVNFMLMRHLVFAFEYMVIHPNCAVHKINVIITCSGNEEKLPSEITLESLILLVGLDNKFLPVSC